MHDILQVGAWRVIGTTRDRVGESPVWDDEAQALWWVDIEGRQLRRFDAGRQATQSWETPERTGCIALTRRGTVVAAMESGVFELTPAEDTLALRRMASITHARPGMRFNDGRCDPDGRFWISTMVMDMSLAQPAGALHVLDENGLSGPRVEGLITSNGLAFSPDGRRAWLSDSHPTVQQIWTFERTPGTGELSGRRPWVDMRPLPGRPDGAAVDSEGCYWICGNDAGQIHRFNGQGELMQSLAVPVPKPAMCCFGGPDLRTLFVTSIQPAVEPGQLGDSGALLACDVGVAGLPEPRFTRFQPSG
jgi:sugar lactone lactonase YvrE